MEKIIKENLLMLVTCISICLDTKRRVTNIYGETKTVTIPQNLYLHTQENMIADRKNQRRNDYRASWINTLKIKGN